MDIYITFFTLLLALTLFVWGKVRHDLVAIICLLILVVSGIINPSDAFIGFAHPAVITVAMILIVSAGLQHSGLIDLIGTNLLKMGNNMLLQIGSLCLLVAVLSAFMNNVGALAVLMPVAIHIARKSGHPVSNYLMPLAFSSLLGGMTTLIGTPPNIIISTFRAEALGAPYQMFDFAYIGVPLTLIGLIYIIFFSWRLLPRKKSGKDESDTFHIRQYITEVRLIKGSKLIGESLLTINKLAPTEVNVLGLIRDESLMHSPGTEIHFKEDDVLIIEADSSAMKEFIEKSKSKLFARKELEQEIEGEREIIMMEAVIMSNSSLIGQTAASLQLRNRFSINLLAIARRGRKMTNRLANTQFKSGDVLLLHGNKSSLRDIIIGLDCVPIADRGFDINKPKKVLTALGIFAVSIALVISGMLSVQIAFTVAALLMVVSKVLPLRDLYSSVDWPVIVLLGAMLPLGEALETTGGVQLIADFVLDYGGQFPIWITLSLFVVITMLLSNIINNAATVVLMAPIGISVAGGLNVSVDAFLMAVAIASSAAFLSPIGHQSNTLVMGPGGYKFIDFGKVGLPITIITAIVTVFLVLLIWV